MASRSSSSGPRRKRDRSEAPTPGEPATRPPAGGDDGGGGEGSRPTPVAPVREPIGEDGSLKDRERHFTRRHRGRDGEDHDRPARVDPEP